MGLFGCGQQLDLFDGDRACAVEADVVRLLADRLMVMKSGRVVEQGLTDQVLDDPQHGYTQLLVSSVLQV